MASLHCNRFDDCVNCPSYGKEVFYYLKLIHGYNYRQYYFKQNEILFFLSGKIRIQGFNIPDTIVSGGEMLAFPVGVEIDMELLEDVTCIAYRWEESGFICETQGQQLMTPQPSEIAWKPMEIKPPIMSFVESVRHSIAHGISCRKLWSLKEQELLFLLNAHYPLPELLDFLTPILVSLNRFKSFVRRNYYKVHTVEELALLGRYSNITFRRMFQQEFGEPAHRWMSRQKQEHILYDLTHRDVSISELSYKYQFESLSQFSNYCKKNLGASPREIMKRRKMGNSPSEDEKRED